MFGHWTTTMWTGQRLIADIQFTFWTLYKHNFASFRRYSIQMEKDLTYVRFIGSSLRSPENLPDLIVLYANNDFELRTVRPTDYSRWVMENGSWLFTNQPTPELTAKKLRKEAYETEDVIEYDDTVLTVDEANKLYMSYLAEGNNSKCSQLQQLICEAKTTIRNTYPDDKEA